MTVELYSHEKIRGGDPRPRYYPQTPLTTLPLSSSALLLYQHSQKSHTKVKGRDREIERERERGGVNEANIFL